MKLILMCISTIGFISLAGSTAVGAPSGCPAGVPAFYMRKLTEKEIERALPEGIHNGHVTVRCSIGADNRPRACRVVEEKNARGGSVQAALKLAANVQLKAPDCAKSASLEGQTVTLPFNF